MIQIELNREVYVIPSHIIPEADFDYYIAAAKSYNFETRSDDIFVFFDGELTRIGLLSYDGTGYQWCVKRLSKGNVHWQVEEDKVSKISTSDLQIILKGGNPDIIETA